MIPLVTVAVLLAMSIAGWILVNQHDAPRTDAFIVIISHDHAKQTVPSREPTVGSLLNKLNIQLNEGDIVEPAASTKINQDDFRINIYRAVPVEIIDGGKSIFTFSAATTPRSIARQAGLRTVAEDEVVTRPVQNFLTQHAIGEQVIINRSTPVNINLYGAITVAHTRAKTVAGLIKEKHIKLAKSDEVTPALDSLLTPDTQITIARHGTKLDTVTEEIPMPVQRILDDNLAYGTSAVRQQGASGKKITTYNIRLVNGREVGRDVIQSVVVQQPVTEIVVQGTSLSGIKGDMALAGISAGDYQYADYIISHESGWCPTKAQGQYGGCPVYTGYVPSYGGYGLCQSTPGSKMSSAGDDWATNPITQLKWCHGYAIGRYGSWYAAYSHWLSYHNW